MPALDCTTTWDTWCDDECCTSASTSTSSITWYAWNTSACTGSTANIIWDKWSSCTTQTTRAYTRVHRVELSAEELEKREADWAAQEEIWRKRREEDERQRKAAEDRAGELLCSCLTQRQRRAYKHFTVQARDGTRFRLAHGWSGNVQELDRRGRPVARYCIHPRESVPVPDNLLAQKLLLETDPDTFRKVANRTVIPVGA
jgi:hypothetical protein